MFFLGNNFFQKLKKKKHYKIYRKTKKIDRENFPAGSLLDFTRLTIRLFAAYLSSADRMSSGVSKLLMRLSYHIHRGYGKKFGLTWRSNKGPPERWPSKR